MSLGDVLGIVFVAIPSVTYLLILFFLAFGELTAPWRARRQYRRRIKEIQARRGSS